MSAPIPVLIDPERVGHAISPRLFGLFFEDINFGLDGGLNANLVSNHSFEAVYLDRRGHSFLIGAVVLHKKPRRLVDRARHWTVVGGELEVVAEDPDADHGHHARVTTTAKAIITNHGYPGSRPGMGARAGVPLDFSALVRTNGFDGSVSVRLVDADGHVVAAADTEITGDQAWQRAAAGLVPARTALVSLQVVLTGRGVLDLDEVSLVAADHWGAGDPRWSQGRLRRDLVETIAGINPTFLRFPGGCIVEGLAADNAYDWKQTIGPIRERRGDYSLWGLHRADGDYHQSHQIGFYEFFLLCEDLGIQAIPVVPAGVCCQIMAKGALGLDSPAFAELTQDVLDLIDWATGDPQTSPWAARRAEAGHPEPFELRTIGIGNENSGQVFFDRFDRLRAAVTARHPDIEIVMSGSPGSSGRKYDGVWEHARTLAPGVVVDEHFYASPSWFASSAHRYDDYDRASPPVFVGEYAAQFPNITTPKRWRRPANTYASALAEAAFYTGVIRNSDIVVMTSYAPLLNLVEEGQWSQNLIDFNPFTVQPTVNYEMQKFFTDALGDRLVELPALPDGVTAACSRTEDTLYLHLVNHTDQDISLVLDLGGSVHDVAASELRERPAHRHTLAFADTAVTSTPERPVATISSPAGVVVTMGAMSVCRLVGSLIDGEASTART